MKKITSGWMVLLLLLPLGMLAQDKGVHFEHGLTWAQVQAKAKTENKFIFMDCFTSWCGPCKMMDTLVYPQQVAGDFMNSHFISIKVQMNRAAGDSPDLKLLYSDADAINNQYHVVAYPTFLFFAPDGHIVHRMTGGIPIPKLFIDKAADALDPAKQYYTLLAGFDKNPGADPDNIRKLTSMAYYNHVYPAITKFAAAYLATQQDVYTTDNVKFMYLYTQSSSDKSFAPFLLHPGIIDSVMGKGTAARKVQEIAGKEDYFNNLAPGEKPEWKAKEIAINKKYPGFCNEIMAMFYLDYYRSENDWGKLGPAMAQYTTMYPTDIDPMEMDGFAQDIFENCPDKYCLQVAIDWSKRAKEMGNFTSEITYANLLYKTGDTRQAIPLMQKLVDRIGIGNNIFEDLLAKMKKGEKTWTTP